MSRLGVRGTPLSWLFQEPTQVATVSQIVAHREPRGLVWVCVGHHSAGPVPTKVAKVSQIAASQGAARSRLGVRGTPLRWPSQEPTQVATVSLFAAPQAYDLG